MTQPTILINLVRCTGCWTCSLACKVGNNLGDDEWWQHVRTLGSGEGIDRPAGIWPDLHMSWIPIHTTDCTMCGERTEAGKEPFCTHNCPNGAMTYGDFEDPSSDVVKKLDDLRGRGYRIFKLPEWERSRTEIVYASRG